MKKEKLEQITTPSGDKYSRWKVGKWVIELSDRTGYHGWIIPEYSRKASQGEPNSQSFIRYENGSVAYDSPSGIPKYVKEAVIELTDKDGRYNSKRVLR